MLISIFEILSNRHFWTSVLVFQNSGKNPDFTRIPDFSGLSWFKVTKGDLRVCTRKPKFIKSFENRKLSM